MPTYYLNSTSGDDVSDGLSELRPWRSLDRLQRHIYQEGASGDRYLLRAGNVFAGSLGCHLGGQVHFGSYDGSATAVIRSGSRDGIYHFGQAQLSVDGITVEGDGRDIASGVNVCPQSEPCAGVTLRRVRATGYARAGILLAGALSQGEVRDCHLHGNAVGLFTSGNQTPDGYGIRNLNILDSVFDANNLPDPTGLSGVNGFGCNLAGVMDASVLGCRFTRNGNVASEAGGHAGLIVQFCRRVRMLHCHSEGNSDPTADGDGQGFVIDDSEDVEVAYCTAEGDRTGFSAHGEANAPLRRVVFRNNLARNCMVGLNLLAGDGDVWFLDNQVECAAVEGEYKVALNIHDAGGPSYFFRNLFSVRGAAHLLMAAGPRGLANVHGLTANDWLAENPSFVVRGIGHDSLTAALAAEPVGV